MLFLLSWIKKFKITHVSSIFFLFNNFICVDMYLEGNIYLHLYIFFVWYSPKHDNQLTIYVISMSLWINVTSLPFMEPSVHVWILKVCRKLGRNIIRKVKVENKKCMFKKHLNSSKLSEHVRLRTISLWLSLELPQTNKSEFESEK